jgi:IclR family acetate operon transcriptional repressor
MPRESHASVDRRARGRPRDWHDKTEQNTIKSLDRAMEVFERLSEMGGATLSALADDLDASPATVYRILVTLEGRGLVDFEPYEQVWNIGPRAFLIGARFLRRTSLVERARPIMRSLMEATGETANLGIERDGSVIFVSQVETHRTIRAFFPPGTQSPMHSSGIGKALLAHMDPARQARILDAATLEGFTPHTLTSRAALVADLAATAARGYSIDAEERNLGMRCIAAPIFDVHGEVVAGVSVSGPSIRIPDAETAQFAKMVTQAAQDLTRAIGGQSSQ